MSWNTVITEDGYELINGSMTILKFSPSCYFNVVALLDKMEELDVPIGYSKGLKYIKFTKLCNKELGDYYKSCIRLSVNKKTNSTLARVLIHELAHHLNSVEDLEDDKLIKECSSCWHKLPLKVGIKNADEYLALGFEAYYCSEREKRLLKKRNPVLYKKIESIHYDKVLVG